LHPGSRILIYVLAALAIPGLPFVLLGPLLLAALSGIWLLDRHPGRLLWRTRWLLLMLVLGYGYSVPGDAMWQALGDWAPTWSGLMAGVEHAARLVVLLLWLDVLVLALTPARMLSGLYALLHPLRWCRVDAGRVALRIALTLKAIEGMEHARHATGRVGNHLRGLFDPVPDPRIPHQVLLMRYPLRLRDVLVPLALAGLGLWQSGLWNP